MTKEEFEEFLNYLMVQDKQGNIIPINKEQMLLQYKRITNFIKKEKDNTSKTRRKRPFSEQPTIS